MLEVYNEKVWDGAMGPAIFEERGRVSAASFGLRQVNMPYIFFFLCKIDKSNSFHLIPQCYVKPN